jgi:hypothetical protein
MKEHKQVLIMSVSIAPKVPLVLTGLTATIRNEGSEWKMI